MEVLVKWQSAPANFLAACRVDLACPLKLLTNVCPAKRQNRYCESRVTAVTFIATQPIASRLSSFCKPGSKNLDNLATATDQLTTVFVIPGLKVQAFGKTVLIFFPTPSSLIINRRSLAESVWSRHYPNALRGIAIVCPITDWHY